MASIKNTLVTSYRRQYDFKKKVMNDLGASDLSQIKSCIQKVCCVDINLTVLNTAE